MCEFTENNIKCSKKNKYGDYCCKHKRNHLIQNDFIIFNNFTNKPSDYLKDDIVKTLNFIEGSDIYNLKNLPKQEYPHLGSFIWAIYAKISFSEYEYTLPSVSLAVIFKSPPSPTGKLNLKVGSWLIEISDSKAITILSL